MSVWVLYPIVVLNTDKFVWDERSSLVWVCMSNNTPKNERFSSYIIWKKSIAPLNMVCSLVKKRIRKITGKHFFWRKKPLKNHFCGTNLLLLTKFYNSEKTCCKNMPSLRMVCKNIIIDTCIYGHCVQHGPPKQWRCCVSKDIVSEILVVFKKALTSTSMNFWTWPPETLVVLKTSSLTSTSKDILCKHGSPKRWWC